MPHDLSEARLSFRVASDVKSLVDRAAALSGLTATAFAVTALTDRAREVVAQHESVALSARDFDRFLELLDTPPEPNEALVSARERHRKLVGGL